MEVNIPKNWSKALSVLATMAALVIPVLIWWADQETKGLTIDVVSKASLQTEIPAPSQIVAVTVDGKVVDKPYLSQLEVSNSGSQSISAADFESAAIIQAGKAQVLQASVTSRSPLSLSPKLTTSAAGIVLQPLLLNPGDRIRLTVVTSGGKPSFTASARVAGVRDLRVSDKLEAQAQRRAWTTVAGLAVLVFMYCALFVAFTEYTAKELRRWPLLAGAFSCLLAAAAVIAPYGSSGGGGNKLLSVPIGVAIAGVGIFAARKLLRPRAVQEG